MVFPSFDLTGQVALVTGAARGLGSAISLALAHAGADVALGLRDVNARGDLANQIGAMGRRAMPLQMDVRRLDQIFRRLMTLKGISEDSTSWSIMRDLRQIISQRTCAKRTSI